MDETAFIHRVRAVVRKVEIEAGMVGLTMRSRYLLDVIGERQSEPPRVTELIKLAQSGTPPSIYSSVSELERGGWVTRVPDAVDGRCYRLVLTPQAKRAFAKMSRGVLRLNAKRPSGCHSIS